MSDIDLYLQQNNLNTETDEFLEHHGVKGMRWGVLNKKIKSNIKENINDFKQHPIKLIGSAAFGGATGIIIRKVIEKRANQSVALLASLPAAILGAKMAQKILHVDGKGKEKSSGDRFAKLMMANVNRYNRKISKRSTPPPSQRAVLALRRMTGKPTPSKEEVNKQFKEQNSNASGFAPISDAEANKKVQTFLKKHPTGRI